MLAGIFERCIQRRGIQTSDPYDWEKPNATNEGIPTTKSLPTVTIPSALMTTTTINQLPTPPNVDFNNQENVEPDNKKELEVKICLIINIKNIFNYLNMINLYKIGSIRL